VDTVDKAFGSTAEEIDQNEQRSRCFSRGSLRGSTPNGLGRVEFTAPPRSSCPGRRDIRAAAPETLRARAAAFLQGGSDPGRRRELGGYNVTSELLRGHSVGSLRHAIMALRNGGTMTDPGDRDFGKIRCPACSNVEVVPGHSALGGFYPVKLGFRPRIWSTSFVARSTIMACLHLIGVDTGSDYRRAYP
jgi:hypothetical protein